MISTNYISKQLIHPDLNEIIQPFHLGWFDARGQYYPTLKLEINENKELFIFKKTKFIIFNLTYEAKDFKYLAMSDNAQMINIGFWKFKDVYVNTYNYKFEYEYAELANKDYNKFWLK